MEIAGELTAAQLNRATLARQLLLRREPLSVLDGVRRVMALQAQEAASPYLALWNRLAGFDPTDLDAAFTDHRVVKATLMRVTLHAVHAQDHPVFHHALAPRLRAARLADARFTGSGLSEAEVETFLPHLLAYLSQPRTNAEIEAMITDRLGGREGLWWALRTFAPLRHAPTAKPWSFGPRPAYLAAAGPQLPPEQHDDSVRYLVRRYLDAFGPASVPDVAQFTHLTRNAARAATEGLPEYRGPGGEVLFDVPGGPVPAGDTPAPPRLMAMWDSVLLAYSDRSRVIPPEYRRAVIRNNGDVLPTLLVDGQVAGVWRPSAGGIEATAFHRLPKRVWTGLAKEAAALTALLADRDPAVYRRYARWWAADLPGTEVRVLPG